MTVLPAALARYEAALRVSGSPAADLLVPGVGDARTMEALQRVGLRPTLQVLEWFAWHDGMRRPEACVPRGWFLTLEAAIQEYAEGVHGDWDADGIGVGWLPIVQLKHGAYIAAWCLSPRSGDLDASSEVTYYDEGHPQEREHRAPSLDVPVIWWAERLEDGVWLWDRRTNTLEQPNRPRDWERDKTLLV